MPQTESVCLRKISRWKLNTEDRQVGLQIQVAFAKNIPMSDEEKKYFVTKVGDYAKNLFDKWFQKHGIHDANVQGEIDVGARQ